MPLAQSAGEFYTTVGAGPALQRLVPASEHGLATTVTTGGHTISNLILSDGYKVIAVGVTSSQAGSISVQRYLDLAGTIAQGAALTAALTAATAGVLNNDDGAAFQSFTVTIANTGGSTATLTNLGVLLQAQ